MAVYTPVDTQSLKTFLARYDIGDLLDYKGIEEGVENSNFLLQTTLGNFILTLYEKRVKAEDLPFFMDLMTFLSQKGLPCPMPIKDKNHTALHELCGRPSAITSFLPGTWPRITEPFHCRAVGECLALLHEATWDFPGHRQNPLSLEGWKNLYSLCESRADETEVGLAGTLYQELRFLEENWPDTLPTGVIHADLFQDNVFFQEEKITGIIDFYFACTDFFTYDIAITLNAWCFDTNLVFNTDKSTEFLQAYQNRKTLEPEEKEALPILARGAALRFLLTRLFDWQNHPKGAFVTPKDPLEYLVRLKFFQSPDKPLFP